MRAVRDFLRDIPELPGTMGNVSYLTDWDHHPARIPWENARRELNAEAEVPER